MPVLPCQKDFGDNNKRHVERKLMKLDTLCNEDNIWSGFASNIHQSAVIGKMFHLKRQQRHSH